MFRWGFIVFGGIDGYSKLITMLHVSTNNRPDAALNIFCGAIHEIVFQVECVLRVVLNLDI